MGFWVLANENRVLRGVVTSVFQLLVPRSDEGGLRGHLEVVDPLEDEPLLEIEDDEDMDAEAEGDDDEGKDEKDSDEDDSEAEDSDENGQVNKSKFILNFISLFTSCTVFQFIFFEKKSSSVRMKIKLKVTRNLNKEIPNFLLKILNS